MKPHPSKPRHALNKAFLKVKANRADIERFKTNLATLVERINESESEEFHKNLVSDFLKKTYYEPAHYINTKGRNDLVIHNGANAQSTVGVIIETKKPTNKSEMVAPDNLNTKAFHELLLYFLRERITHKNLELKHLIITNLYEWYIFDATVIDRLFAQDKNFVQHFRDFESKSLIDTTTDFFYTTIAHPFITNSAAELPFTYFSLRDYYAHLDNADSADDTQLIALFKLLSPEHLLKLPFVNDSNTLDRQFYNELLHIIGLTETVRQGRKLIERHEKGKRHTGTILEDTIIQLDSLDKIRILETHHYGDSYQERLFSVALELSITWINRILFLKLMEAQLLTYHKGAQEYAFLTSDKIKNYDDLNSLFFQVLARQHDERNADVQKQFEKVPYLNSSLFEPTDLEQKTLFISNLKDDKTIPVYAQTVLKDRHGRKITGELTSLDYLFRFLDAYDFSSVGSEEIQEENKSLINASVLGLIFEKINGYKDGSFFTPGFITMYMCRDALRRAVVHKFNQVKNWQCHTLDDVYNKIDDRTEANDIINSIKICDPAVGSGHFLVSALNEIIAIKNDLKILLDCTGKRLKEYHVEVVNDELVITDDEGELFDYTPTRKEAQRVQKALFHEKETIIENCLFGVDINPNSVKICRLRLWIELLKNAYYKNATELETLPNIDINIKCGNSLLNRFDLTADLGQTLKKSKWTIESYRLAVASYRSATTKEQKREMEKLIADIKSDFRTEIAAHDPKVKKLKKLAAELFEMTNQPHLIEMSKKEQSAWEKKQKKLIEDTKKLEQEIEDIRTNRIYENAFEWRFEFPEVLDGNGDFTGFDVVIGNPPYVQIQKMESEHKAALDAKGYKTFAKTGDIYCLFYERGMDILKPQGYLCYITSNKWMRAAYGKPLRSYFTNFNPLVIIDLGPGIFESATVDTNILIIEKARNQNNTHAVTLQKTHNETPQIEEYLRKKGAKMAPVGEATWYIGSAAEQRLKQKIENIGTPLKDWDVNIYRGVLTGLNEAFIVDTPTKERLCAEDPRSAEILKPILRGRDIKRYTYNWADLWLIASGYDLDVPELYPAVYQHLLQFEDKAIKRYDKGKNWWNLRACDYYPEFEKEKIVWKRIGSILRFGLDTACLYSQDSTCIMCGKDLRYLCGYMNSKLSNNLLFEKAPKTGTGDLIVSVQALEPLLVPSINSENKNYSSKIESIVESIIKEKQKSHEADTTPLEKEIDQLVYQLYDLNQDEIALIENA